MSKLDDIFITPLGFYETYDNHLSYGFIEDYDATEDIAKAKQQIKDLIFELMDTSFENGTGKLDYQKLRQKVEEL